MKTATKKKQKAPAASNIPPAAEQRQRIEYMDLDVLLEFPKNPKDHDFEALEEAFEQNGFVTPLLIDETSGLLVEGHGRLQKLKQLKDAGEKPPARVWERDGKWSAPVVRGIWFETLDQAKRHLLGANRIGQGMWTNKLTAEMLTSLGEGNLLGTGFRDTDLVKFVNMTDPEFLNGFNPSSGGTNPSGELGYKDGYLTFALKLLPSQDERLQAGISAAKKKYKVKSQLEAILAMCDSISGGKKR